MKKYSAVILNPTLIIGGEPAVFSLMTIDGIRERPHKALTDVEISIDGINVKDLKPEYNRAQRRAMKRRKS